jgi:thioredoxin reductase (NADPH)
MTEDRLLDLLIIGAGPTGIAVGAEARRAELDVLLVDKGPLTASLQAYPTDLEFFTTRELLEIANVPFAIAESKPNRRQALVYYREVVRRFQVPLALYEEVVAITPREDGTFVVDTRRAGGPRRLRARAVAVATGYFWWPQRLGVAGEELPWVQTQYLEPYPHFDQHVVVVGGGNSAVKVALDLWRNAARVTLVHRRAELKPTIKYWMRPDIDNRIAEGAIAARFETTVRAFLPAADGEPRRVELAGPQGIERLAADFVYLQVGYRPDVSLLRGAGVSVDSSLRPAFDPQSCETDVPGLYVAGTVQAGENTGKLFIENSRDHGERIVRHLLAGG